MTSPLLPSGPEEDGEFVSPEHVLYRLESLYALGRSRDSLVGIVLQENGLEHDYSIRPIFEEYLDRRDDIEVTDWARGLFNHGLPYLTLRTAGAGAGGAIALGAIKLLNPLLQSPELSNSPLGTALTLGLVLFSAVSVVGTSYYTYKIGNQIWIEYQKAQSDKKIDTLFNETVEKLERSWGLEIIDADSSDVVGLPDEARLLPDVII